MNGGWIEKAFKPDKGVVAMEVCCICWYEIERCYSTNVDSFSDFNDILVTRPLSRFIQFLQPWPRMSDGSPDALQHRELIDYVVIVM